MAASPLSLEATESNVSLAEDASLRARMDTEPARAITPEVAAARAPAARIVGSAASDARLQAALLATSRADASLSTLMQAVRDLSTGVSSAREANGQLVGELGALADLLGAANERQLALKNRVVFLEQALLRAQKEASSQQAYILNQHDAFIAEMMEEHQREMKELHQELDGGRERVSQRPTAMPGMLAQAPAATEAEDTTDVRAELEAARSDIAQLVAERERTRETLLKLQAQRDEAQASVVALTRARERTRAEGAKNRISDAVRQAIPGGQALTQTPGLRMASTMPPPESPPVRSPSSSPRKKSGSDASAQDSVPPNPSTRTTAPMPLGSRPLALSLELAPLGHRIPSPPPDELRAALHPPSMPSPPEAGSSTSPPETPRGPEAVLVDALTEALTSGAPSKGRPRTEPSQRPAGGYSLTSSIAPEHVDTSRVSRPPRR